jgi:cyclopropane-fatty-acyl-phospholipid synthase
LTAGFELMADRADIDFTYSLTDRIFRLSLGELADFSGAKYDGDFSLRLEEAQRRKHQYVAEQIGIGPDRRILDLGCGWGPLLNFIRAQGASELGVTLSSAQEAACRRHDLDVHLYDARLLDRESFGEFDAVASLGAFEHFCSVEEYRHGRQEEIYRSIFARIASVLPERGRLYMQTMVFGRNMIPLDEVDVHAPRDSDAWYLALMERQFPGSWLPIDQEQVVRCAQDDFDLVSSSNGLLDYIQTITEWGKRTGARSIRKTLLKLQLVPRWLTSTDFRLAFTSGVSANKVCFERELLDHCRMVFEKRDRRPGPSRRAFGTAIITSELCLAQAAVGRNVSVCFRLLAEYL